MRGRKEGGLAGEEGSALAQAIKPTPAAAAAIVMKSLLSCAENIAQLLNFGPRREVVKLVLSTQISVINIEIGLR